MKVYAFDVDETLEISNGPVTLSSMLELRKQGHAVGLCGNLHCFMERVPNWPEYISFTTNFDTLLTLGGLLPKEYWLRTFKISCRNADEYILVGNVMGERNSLGFVCNSADSKGAEKAGWRFIKEDDFAAGVR